MAQKLNLLNANHLLVWHKKFGTCTIYQSIVAQKVYPAQNILGPVEGRGISVIIVEGWSKKSEKLRYHLWTFLVIK